MRLGERKNRIEKRTHEETGITVHFRRVGFVQKTQLAADSGGEVGALLTQLMQPGVGVQAWEGVEMSDGNPSPYTLAALDAVCEVEPAFGGWFNNALLEVNGMRKAAPGNAEAPPAQPGTPG